MPSSTPEGGSETLRDRIIAGIRDGSLVERLRNKQITGEEEKILFELLMSYQDYLNQTDRPPETFRDNLRRCKELISSMQLEETPPDPLQGKVREPNS